MSDLAEVLNHLERDDRFILTTHLHPDGDGIGSMSALAYALMNRGKRLILVHTEGIPSSYAFLTDEITVHREIPSDFTPSVVIALDCGDRERMAVPLLDPGLPLLNIDHHLSNSMFGLVNFVDPDAAATGELVHHLLVSGGYPLNKIMATSLYVAIATDTGFFRYANANQEVFTLASELIKTYGLEPGKIAEIVHEQKSFNAIKLLGRVLDTLTLAVNGTVAWMYMDEEMLKGFPVEIEETESFINYARSISGVEIALFFKETIDGEVRVSWRSGPSADVSRLAAFFGGGGHARAAGCTLYGHLNEAVKRVLDFLSSWQGAV